MIEKIRKPEKTRNFATYVTSLVIFGMIVATFIFMIPGMAGPTGAVNTAAEVGKATVSLREYNDQLRMVRSQYQKMFNGEIPPFFEANLKGQVLESLVQTEVMSQFAKEQGVIVSDIEVADFVKKEIPAFQEDGQFSLSRYNSYLDSVRLTPAKFEKRVYNDLLRQKIQSVFSLAFQKTDLEDSLLSEGEGLRMKLKYIKYDSSLVTKSTKVNLKDAADFVSLPEGAKQVEAYFNENKPKYSSEKEVKLSYILLEGADAAEKLKPELTQQNFSEKAKLESKDQLSREKGGEVGFIKRGDFDLAIETKVFSMSAGEISEPIKTSQGYAIAYVSEVREASTIEFEENKESIAQDFLKDKAAQVAQEKIKALNKAGDPQALKEFLIKSGHRWSETLDFGLTDAQVPGLGDAKEVFPKLISLSPGETSSKLSFVGNDRYVFMNEGFVNSDKPEDKKENLMQPNSDSRGQEAYFLVYQNEKEKKKIVINNELVAN